MLEKTPSFLKMDDYLSKDENFPNEIIIRLGDLKTFDQGFSTNVKVEMKIDGKFKLIIFQLKPRNSKSSRLWKLWNENVKTKNFIKREIICLLTWKTGNKRYWKLAPSKSLR